jgi:hypothetical protein
VIQLLSGKKKSTSLDLMIPFIPPLLMFFFSHATFWDTFCMWSWIVGVSSFIFAFLGFNGAHHHPDIFHDGDAPR